MDLGTGSDRIRLERHQIVTEVGDHVILDRLTALAGCRELRKVVDGHSALALCRPAGAINGDLQSLVGKGLRRAILERLGNGDHAGLLLLADG
jgi:hypothetical protein